MLRERTGFWAGSCRGAQGGISECRLIDDAEIADPGHRRVRHWQATGEPWASMLMSTASASTLGATSGPAGSSPSPGSTSPGSTSRPRRVLR